MNRATLKVSVFVDQPHGVSVKFNVERVDKSIVDATPDLLIVPFPCFLYRREPFIRPWI
jgi:hypothetical protein